MLFPTIEFAIFFFAVFFITWHLKRNSWRKVFLVLASYGFYGFWDARFTLLLFQCSLSNFIIGKLLSNTGKEEITKRRTYLTLAIVLNLGILCVFKYYGFFLTNISDALQGLGLSREIPIMEIVLPVGISFFTFQGMSYVIDIYRGRLSRAFSLLDVMLYISFFPQLVAGPIVRADEFLPQLEDSPSPDRIPTAFALSLITIGLVKKVFIAHYLSSQLVSHVLEDPLSFSALDVLMGIYGYAAQIYCDFSAYSDMAIGFAALLGYRFSKNFDQPYRAASLQDFWRRWHISLSKWLRDYLYISLGGSRGGRWKTYRNLFLTMFLGGLWHGAAWKFIIWGMMHGTYLAIEKALRDKFGPLAKDATTKAISILIVFHFVCLTWIFFAAPSFNLAIEYIKAFGNFHLPVSLVNPFTVFLVFAPLAAHFINHDVVESLGNRITEMPLAARGLILGSLLVLLSAISPAGVSPFIYFQF